MIPILIIDGEGDKLEEFKDFQVFYDRMQKKYLDMKEEKEKAHHKSFMLGLWSGMGGVLIIGAFVYLLAKIHL